VEGRKVDKFEWRFKALKPYSKKSGTNPVAFRRIPPTTINFDQLSFPSPAAMSKPSLERQLHELQLIQSMFPDEFSTMTDLEESSLVDKPTFTIVLGRMYVLCD
jgi:hypothetical protein